VPHNIAVRLLEMQEWVAEFVETNKTYHIFLVISIVYVLSQLPDIINYIMGKDR
jgi:hypothetical protein